MTDNFEKKVAVDGPVVNAGELGSSTFSPGQALPAGPLGLGQRWTVARKREVVLRLLRDEPVQLLSRQLGVEIFRLEQWREKAIGGIDGSLKQRKAIICRRRLDLAWSGFGQLTVQVELLEAKTETFCPFGAAEVAAISAATSPGTGPAYDLLRVCRRLGHGTNNVLRHDLRPAHRSARSTKAVWQDRSSSIKSDQAACWSRSKQFWTASSWRTRVKLPQDLDCSSSGLSSTSGSPSSRRCSRPDDARTICSRTFVTDRSWR